MAFRSGEISPTFAAGEALGHTGKSSNGSRGILLAAVCSLAVNTLEILSNIIQLEIECVRTASKHQQPDGMNSSTTAPGRSQNCAAPTALP